MTLFSKSTQKLKNPATHQLLMQIFHATSSTDSLSTCNSITCDKKSTDLSFQYISNPDGSLRWITPSKAKKPYFLSLYNNDSLKAWIFKQGVQLGYQLGSKKALFQGSFSLAAQERYRLLELIRPIAGDEFAIFTGTAGKTRKTVVALAPQGRVSHFLKIAHSERAHVLLQQEQKHILQLRNKAFRLWEIPQVQPTDFDHICMISNVKPTQVQQQQAFTKLHMLALQELWADQQMMPLAATSWINELQHKLFALADPQAFPNDLDKQKVGRIITKLKALYQQLTYQSELVTSYAHGDFTPWNMYLSSNKLHVFDWENAQADYPLYYDFFHYFYQSEILLKHKSDDLLAQIASWATSHLEAQWMDMHKWYLLITLTHYLHDYASWKDVFVQAHWLISAWDNMLSSIVK